MTIYTNYIGNQFERTNTVNHRRTVSDEDRKRIIEKTLEGISVKAISSDLNIKYQTVNSIVKRYLKTGNILATKRGGNHRTKLDTNIKANLIEYIDDNPTKTLKELKRWVFSNYNIAVSESTINRCLKEFHYTLKTTTIVPESRNYERTINLRAEYESKFRLLEVDNNDRNFIFIDEIGFSVVSRAKRGRSLRNTSSYVNVSAARSRNISVVAAINKYGVLYHKIQERSVNGEDFKICLREIKLKCNDNDINSPIFIMDNARIHHYRGIKEDSEFINYHLFYLPPYSPFLNPIENVFSVWKNLVIRGEAKNENHLRSLITEKFNEITPNHCESFYRKMLGYLLKAAEREIILE